MYSRSTKSAPERQSASAIDTKCVAASLEFSIVEMLPTGRGVRSRVWGTSFGDLTIESFNSTRTGLKSSAEGSLTRCVVGHQEGGGAILPELKLGVEDATLRL